MVATSEMYLLLKWIREGKCQQLKGAWECSDADELFIILYRDYPEEAAMLDVMLDMDLI